ncbi:MAG: (2Fe-2S)-binding protein [Candidatus Neomarinimicrobiota bacterium]
MRIVEGVRQVVERGPSFHIEVDGSLLLAYEGETVAAVLLANGRQVLRRTRVEGKPRGVFCGIGVCYDCLVVVNGRPNVRGCMTLATPGLRVETQRGVGEEQTDEPG